MAFHLDDLTPREYDVLREVSKGYSNPVIAERLFLSESTVKNHLTSIYAKLRNRYEIPENTGISMRSYLMSAYFEDYFRKRDLEIEFGITFDPVNDTRGEVERRAREEAKRRIKEAIDETGLFRNDEGATR